MAEPNRPIKGKCEISEAPGGSGADQTSCDSDQTCCEVDDIKKNFFNFGQPVKLSFDDVYAQDSEDNRTALGKAIGGGLIANYYTPLFHWTQACFYYSLAIPIGALLSILWGALFGFNKLLLVWVVQPALKFLYSWMRVLGTLRWKPIEQCCASLTK